MHGLPRTATAAALIGFEAATIVALHRLGSLGWMSVPWSSVQTWLEVAPIEDVVAASLRSIALVVAYWITLSTVAYALARALRLPKLIAATAWATLPPIRRVIDRAIAITVTTAVLASPIAPALANEPPPTTEPVIFQISEQGVPTPVSPPLIDPTLITPPGVEGAGYTPRPAGGVVIGAQTSETLGEVSYQVIKGDNLWTISQSHLRAAFPDREVEVAEISVYWRQVIELNTPTLQSNDPNLIYPGEQIVLPPIVQGGET